MKNNKNGFTLAEIMVALIVAAVLASMALPRMLVFSEKIKSQEAKQVLLLIYAEQRLYYKENNGYANDISKLNIEFTAFKNFKNLDVTDVTSTVVGSLGGAESYLASLTDDNDVYQLYVLEDGTVVCTPDGVGTDCYKMGYPLF